MTDETDPTIMAGQGEYKTVTVRGTGFAPKKQRDLLSPMGGESRKRRKTQKVKKVGETALDDQIE